MRKIEKTAGLLAFALSAVYYILNRYPGLAFIDSGELALSSLVLGVPHPTGYPLYVILTRPATIFLSRPIESVTIFSALLTGITVFIFFYFTNLLLHDLLNNHKIRTVCALIMALVFAFAPVISAQATTNEVYGLSLLINLIIMLCIFRHIESRSPGQKFRYLLLVFYLVYYQFFY